jgi:hypothetical protein
MYFHVTDFFTVPARTALSIRCSILLTCVALLVGT